MAEGDVILIEHLPNYLQRALRAEDDESILTVRRPAPLGLLLMECEKQAILRALEEAGNNRTKAMKVLRISRRSFYKKANKYKILDIYGGKQLQ